MSADQHLKKQLDEDGILIKIIENVILSASVKKFNDFKKEQTRILIITNKKFLFYYLAFLMQFLLTCSQI